jgi:hypothetical protein
MPHTVSLVVNQGSRRVTSLEDTGLEPTGKGLVEFLEHAAKRGMLNGNTAGGLRAASKEVLTAVEPQGWEAVDLRTIDVEDFAARFERLRAGKFKPDSLLVYKSRFRNAVGMYLEYLKAPSTWKYKAERPAAARKKSAGGQAGKGDESDTLAQASETRARSGSLEYPFPLRQGLVVKLHLPADLTRPEAKRLAAFIDALAVDSTLALPAHAGDNGGATSAVER